MGTIRDLAFKMKNDLPNMVLLLASTAGEKVNLSLYVSENLVKEKNLNAGTLIRDIAREIAGGGGGQPHFATAGGKNAKGINNAFQKARQLIEAV